MGHTQRLLSLLGEIQRQTVATPLAQRYTHWTSTALQLITYCIVGNFGEVFNLANWQIGELANWRKIAKFNSFRCTLLTIYYQHHCYEIVKGEELSVITTKFLDVNQMLLPTKPLQALEQNTTDTIWSLIACLALPLPFEYQAIKWTEGTFCFQPVS